MNYQELFSLKGKRVLVTGAGRASGIGAAIAKGMADFGADVALHDISNNDLSVQKEIELKGRCCQFFTQDLSVSGGGKDLIETVEKDFGPLDIVVLNASCQFLGEFTDLTSEQFDKQLNINFRANFEILQTVLPLMSKRKWGRIVNVGSINQSSPKAIVSIYAAAKAATHNLIKSLAREYAPSGVLLNTVAPGLIDTYPDKRAGDAEAIRAWDEYVGQLNWLKRAGEPDEIVGAAVYLASSACSFMSGETLFVTGGYPAQ